VKWGAANTSLAKSTLILFEYFFVDAFEIVSIVALFMAELVGYKAGRGGRVVSPYPEITFVFL
jgi:hypothetical protein